MYICILVLKKKLCNFFYDIREEYNNAKRGRGLEWVEGVCALDNSKKKVSCFYRSLSNIDPVKLGASGYKINNDVFRENKHALPHEIFEVEKLEKPDENKAGFQLTLACILMLPTE